MTTKFPIPLVYQSPSQNSMTSSLWFKGPIPEAIQEARSSSSRLFLVLVVDDSDDSMLLESLFGEDQVRKERKKDMDCWAL